MWCLVYCDSNTSSSILQQVIVFCVKNYMKLVEPRFLSSANSHFHFIIISRLFAKILLSNTLPDRTLAKAQCPSITCYYINTQHDLGEGRDIHAILALPETHTFFFWGEKDIYGLRVVMRMWWKMRDNHWLSSWSNHEIAQWLSR